MRIILICVSWLGVIFVLRIAGKYENISGRAHLSGGDQGDVLEARAGRKTERTLLQVQDLGTSKRSQSAFFYKNLSSKYYFNPVLQRIFKFGK